MIARRLSHATIFSLKIICNYMYIAKQMLEANISCVLDIAKQKWYNVDKDYDYQRRTEL